jgi:acyl dehydratase
MAAPQGSELLIVQGEIFGKVVHYSRDAIASFARATLDTNPLHHDEQAAYRARFGDVIASGQQTSATMMGLVASHFSRADDGLLRQTLLLNVNFSFKHPVYADQDVHLEWRVVSAEWNERLQGMVGQLEGRASTEEGKPNVVARGTVLVQQRQPERATEAADASE